MKKMRVILWLGLRRVARAAFDDLKLPPKTATDTLVQTDIIVNISTSIKHHLYLGLLK